MLLEPRETSCPQQWFFLRPARGSFVLASLPGLQMAIFFLCPFSSPLLYMDLCFFPNYPLYKDTSHTGLKPFCLPGMPSQVAQLVKNPPANAGDTGSIPGLGRSPGEGKGYPLQYSCLGNSMDCVAHRVAKRHDWESFTHSLLTISGSSMSPWLQISSSFSCINEVNFSPNGCFIECHSVPFLPCFEMLVFKVYLKWQVFFFVSCLSCLFPWAVASIFQQPQLL